MIRFKTFDELCNALAEQIVAEVHDKVVVTKELLGDQNAMSQAQRSILRDISDFGSPT